MSLLLALILQVGLDPMGGGMPGDDLVRDRPPRSAVRSEAGQEPIDPVSAWLQSCLDQIESDPARAHTMAQIRRSETSGTERVLANHCLGIAASGLGLWDDARAAFLAARSEVPADEPRARARFAMLAGNAALGGGDTAGALALLEAAQGEAKAAGAPILEALAAIDAAYALVALGRDGEALTALDRATTLAPEAGEAWLLKATLLRRLDRLDEAQAAIERAAALSPGRPAVGLEAGVIAILAGREAAARASWESVLSLAPDTPAAATAQGYLDQLGPAADTAAAPQAPPA